MNHKTIKLNRYDGKEDRNHTFSELINKVIYTERYNSNNNTVKIDFIHFYYWCKEYSRKLQWNYWWMLFRVILDNISIHRVSGL